MATKKIAANLDLLTNQLTNFAIENVENVDKLSTLDLTQKGRIVFCTDDHSLHLYNGSAWVKLAEGTDASSAVNALKLELDDTKVKLNGEGIAFKAGTGLSVTGDATNKNITYGISGLSFKEDNGKMNLMAGDSTTLASFETAKFIKDGMLKTVVGPYTATENGNWQVTVDSKTVTFSPVKKGSTYLGLVWDTNVNDNTDTFTTSLLDVSTLVDVYTAGDGLDLNDGKFSIKIGAQDEGFLTFDENGHLITEDIDRAISDAVADSKAVIDTSISAINTSIDSVKTDISNQGSTLASLSAKITDVEKAYETADDALLGTSSDDANTNTIYGVRNYATSVARLMGGFNFSKQVTNGTTLSLYANTTANATSNNASYMIDLASISVRNKAGERIEVEVKTLTASNTPAVALSWSGITPTASDPLTVNYRVILNQTGA